jgi:hypothetical protein
VGVRSGPLPVEGKLRSFCLRFVAKIKTRSCHLPLFGQTCVRRATQPQQSDVAYFSFPVMGSIRFSGDGVGKWPRPPGQLILRGLGSGSQCLLGVAVSRYIWLTRPMKRAR